MQNTVQYYNRDVLQTHLLCTDVDHERTHQHVLHGVDHPREAAIFPSLATEVIVEHVKMHGFQGEVRL